MNGDPEFRLKPYDIVEVRRSPGYQIQKLIDDDGEVLFGGQYALQRKNERISDIVRRAGGVTDGAYLKGARLLRKMSEDEKAARDESLKLAMEQSDAPAPHGTVGRLHQYRAAVAERRLLRGNRA